MMHVFVLKKGIITKSIKTFKHLTLSNHTEVHMENKNEDQVDSILESLTGFKIKEFLIIIVVAYLSVLTTPAAIVGMGLGNQPLVAIIAVMLVQYFLLLYVGKMHGSGILKTMTQKGFVGWLLWFALVCMLMLPIIHLLKIFGLI